MRRTSTPFGAVDFRAQFGELLDEVLALLLEQQESRVEALEDRLEAATLLGQVADEQALLLEQRLERAELAFLLIQTVAREFDVGLLLAFPLEHRVPRHLQRAQVVDGERDVEVPQLGDQPVVLARLVGLALERTQLALHLRQHVARPLEVRVHGGELAQGAFLALLVLEDARGLLDERAALLGARVQDLVETPLRDDRVRVAAQARSREAGRGRP